jgi:predicted membrane protein
MWIPVFTGMTIYFIIIHAMKKLFVPVLAVFMMLGICSAHQPRIEFDQSHPETNPVVVSNPEISQAFYGDLQGQPDYYQITSDT